MLMGMCACMCRACDQCAAPGAPEHRAQFASTCKTGCTTRSRPVTSTSLFHVIRLSQSDMKFVSGVLVLQTAVQLLSCNAACMDICAHALARARRAPTMLDFHLNVSISGQVHLYYVCSSPVAWHRTRAFSLVHKLDSFVTHGRARVRVVQWRQLIFVSLTGYNFAA